MKIIVSAWPGAGGSTLALFLAYILDYKLILGSQMFRYIGRELQLGDTGKGMLETDKLLQEHFSPLYDAFMKSYMLDHKNDNAVYDTDLISFDARKVDEVVAVFLYSSHEARESRLVVDNRAEDIAVLRKREIQLQESYQKLYGIDFLDVTQLATYYDLVLDNSELSIQAELEYMCGYLSENARVTMKKEGFSDLESIYWTNGKEWFKDKLTKLGSLPTAQELLQQLRESQEELLRKVPESIRIIIESC